MERIIGSRGSGKTNDLIKYAYENNLPIFAANPQDIFIKAALLGCEGVKVYTYFYLLHNEEIFKSAEYVIDDLEFFVRYCAPGFLKGYTLAID